MNYDSLKRRYYEKKATADSQPLPSAAIKFEPPKSVTGAAYQLPGHGLLFCVHGRSYFEPCSASTCRRTKKEADQRLKAFLDKVVSK